MVRETRTHVDEDLEISPGATLKSMTKAEFGRKLYRLMLARGWKQSDLARHAGLQRDAISVYVRGRSFPTPQSLARLATALGVSAAELLPNHTEMAIDHDTPALEIKSSPGAPQMAWLRVNQLVPIDTALKIAEILQDGSADRN